MLHQAKTPTQALTHGNGYILWVDNSPHSHQAVREIEGWANQHNVAVLLLVDGQGANSEGAAPALDTPTLAIEGLAAIRSFCRRYQSA